MKSNRIMWGIVSLVVLMTIAVTVGTMDSRSEGKSTAQSQPTPPPDNAGYEDLSKYVIAEYDAPLPENAVKREKRKAKNQRYDGQYWVVKNPHPDDGGVGRVTEIPPPRAIPTDESALVIIGEVVNASAHLSNDKSGVYTEFDFCVKELIKEDASNKAAQQGGCITADRAGGFVRYPNGQKVLYRNSGQDLPRVGSEYVLFLTNSEMSPNYEILTGYELKENTVSPLDREIPFDSFKDMNRLNFIRAIRDKVLRQVPKPNQ